MDSLVRRWKEAVPLKRRREWRIWLLYRPWIRCNKARKRRRKQRRFCCLTSAASSSPLSSSSLRFFSGPLLFSFPSLFSFCLPPFWRPLPPRLSSSFLPPRLSSFFLPPRLFFSSPPLTVPLSPVVFLQSTSSTDNLFIPSSKVLPGEARHMDSGRLEGLALS